MGFLFEKAAPRHRLTVRPRHNRDGGPRQARYFLDVAVASKLERTIPVRAGAREFTNIDKEIGTALKLGIWSAPHYPTLDPRTREAGLDQLSGAGTDLLGAFAQNRAQHAPNAGWDASDYSYLRNFLGGLKPDEILLVEGDCLPVCWNAIYLGGHFVSRADRIDGFLGARCRVAHSPHDTAPTQSPLMRGTQLLRRVAGGPALRFGFVDDDDVTTAIQHRHYLQSWLGAGLEPLDGGLGKSLHNVAELATFMVRGGRRAAHFICHGEAQHRSSASHQIQVRHKTMVSTQQLLAEIDTAAGASVLNSFGRSAALTQRLVSAHVCESLLPTDPPDQQSFVDGMVRRGVHVGVGLIAQICEGNALAFMEEFYDALQSAPEIGEAFNKALRATLINGNPTFLNYALIGDPDARL